MSKLTSLKNLKGLKGSAPAAPSTEPKVETPAAESTAPADTASSQTTESTVAQTSEEKRIAKSKAIFDEFASVLSDGQAHKIKDLLNHFNLPHTSSGREILRGCRRMIIIAGGQIIEEQIEGSKAIKFALPTTK